jgi:phosphate-selective porin OprO/OprP
MPMRAAGAALLVEIVALVGAPSSAGAQGLLFPPPPSAVVARPEGDDALKAVRFVWREHPSLRFGRPLRLDFGLKIQEDAREPGDAPFEFETYELHRVRIGIDGEMYGRIQFSIERELTENEGVDPTEILGRTKSAWKDYYVDVNATDWFQVRVGRFKIPFGVEQLTGISNLDFIYRSIDANYIAPARDRGVMAHGRFFDRGLNYWAGVFEHDGDNSRSSKIRGGDETAAARLTATPFRTIEAAGLGAMEVGGAFSMTRVSDESVLPNGIRGRTAMSQFTFYEPVFVKGIRTRAEADVDWNTGPFSARAEYTWMSDERNQQGFGDDDLPDARARAWFVSGTWVVTGENKERPVPPRREMFRGGIGAFELAARYERIRFGGVPGDDEPFRNPRAVTIFPVSNEIVTLGVNWYVNRWVKLQGNAIREHIDDPERSPVPNGGAFWSQIVRLQLVL